MIIVGKHLQGNTALSCIWGDQHLITKTFSNNNTFLSFIGCTLEKNFLSVKPVGKDLLQNLILSGIWGDQHLMIIKTLLIQLFSVRVHTRERTFKCENCGKTYARNGFLVKHIRKYFCFVFNFRYFNLFSFGNFNSVHSGEQTQWVKMFTSGTRAYGHEKGEKSLIEW